MRNEGTISPCQHCAGTDVKGLPKEASRWIAEFALYHLKSRYDMFGNVKKCQCPKDSKSQEENLWDFPFFLPLFHCLFVVAPWFRCGTRPNESLWTREKSWRLVEDIKSQSSTSSSRRVCWQRNGKIRNNHHQGLMGCHIWDIIICGILSCIIIPSLIYIDITDLMGWLLRD